MQMGGVSNNSIRTILVKMCEDYKIIKSNKVGGISTLILKNIQKIPQFFKKA